MGQRSIFQERRQPGWIGRDERTRLCIEGHARRANGSVVAVTVADMSREGCRVDGAAEPLAIGEWVEIEAMGMMPQRGQVRWSLLSSAGIQFSDE